MKIHPSRRHQQGSILAITLILIAIIGVTLAAYMDLASNQNRAIARSQAWHTAVPFMEAGMEEALTQLYYNASNLTANSWTSNNNAFSKSRAIGAGRFQAVISNSSPPILYCTGWAKVPFSTNELSRIVQVTTIGGALFARGLVAKGAISMGNGNTDSFNSGGTNTYLLSSKLGGGDIASVTGDISVGPNGDILGKATVSPGHSINNSGYIGPWSATTPSGTTTAGYTDYTLSTSIPDVVLPSFAGATAVNLGANYTFNGSGASGNYTCTGIGNNCNIIVTNGAKIVLYCTGNISFSGQKGINISANSSLTIYMEGGTVSVSGNGMINQGNALNFSLYGMSTCTSLTVGGNGGFVGTVNAPYADLTINGGGSSGTFVGAAIVNSANFNGNGTDFHYDENLKNNGPTSVYVVTGWNEL